MYLVNGEKFKFKHSSPLVFTFFKNPSEETYDYIKAANELDSPNLPTHPVQLSNVWSNIKATQEIYPNTVLPKSFELTMDNGSKVWISPNATKHINEYILYKGNTRGSNSLIQIATQQKLRSLQAALSKSITKNVKFDTMIYSHGWEFMLGKPRTGPLPTVYHARYLGDK